MAVWRELIVPVLVAVGERHPVTGGCVEIEHLLSERVTGALAERIERLRPPLNPHPVLPACAGEEQHSLALYALAAALADVGGAPRALGARTPYHALADAMTRTGPTAVFV